MEKLHCESDAAIGMPKGPKRFGFQARVVGRELIKFLPSFGNAIAAWATVYTCSLGEGGCVYFGDLMGGKKPDPKQIQSVMQKAFQAAKERFKGIKR